MKKLLVALSLFLGLTTSIAISSIVASPTYAQQATTCATRPPGDNSNACATTAFVQTAIIDVCTLTPGTCGTLFGYIYAPWYGTNCTGSFDNSTALGNAISAGISKGIPVRFTGVCTINTGLTINSLLNFGGSGRGISQLAPATGITALTVNSGFAATLHDFDIVYAVQNAGNLAINVQPTGGVSNTGSRFDNLAISNAATCFNYTAADDYRLWNSLCNQFSVAGVTVNNTVNAAGGDSAIYANTFIGSSGSSSCLFYVASGGLRFQNNKCNGLMSGPVVLDLAAGASSSDFIFVGNSIEGGNFNAAISILRQGTTGTFSNVIISSNQLAIQMNNCVSVPTDANGAWLTGLTIIGNICSLANNAAAVGYKIDSAINVNISGNSTSSNNASTKMFAIGSGVLHCGIGINTGDGTFAASTYASSACDSIAPQTLGTTTTLLHGNATGPGAFGPVNLTTDVTGNLTSPIIYGGAAAGSSLALTSTSNVSPSGDSVTISTGGVVRETVVSNGNVGLGTETNPQAALVISKNVTTGLPVPANTLFELVPADGGTGTAFFGGFNNGVATSAGQFAFGSSRGTAASPTATLSGDRFGALGFGGNINASGYTFSGNSALIIATATTNYDATHQGSALSFNTTGTGASAARAQAMYMAAGVNIGTSVTDPGANNLAVGGNESAATHIATGAAPTGTTGSCIASSFVGGSTAGKFSAAVCVAGTIILSALPAAPNGYTCNAQDQTTPADTLQQTANTVTSVTFKATTVASDAIVFQCMGW